MTLMGRIGAALVVGAAAVCAFASAASAQVRTVGPEAPYLMTGRSGRQGCHDRHGWRGRGHLT
jgi:hypothetical protein